MLTGDVSAARISTLLTNPAHQFLSKTRPREIRLSDNAFGVVIGDDA
jgi:hypothetical protein